MISALLLSSISLIFLLNILKYVDKIIIFSSLFKIIDLSKLFFFSFNLYSLNNFIFEKKLFIIFPFSITLIDLTFLLNLYKKTKSIPFSFLKISLFKIFFKFSFLFLKLTFSNKFNFKSFILLIISLSIFSFFFYSIVKQSLKYITRLFLLLFSHCVESSIVFFSLKHLLLFKNQ